MPEFISLKEISKTRKPHRCVSCGDLIAQGQTAWAWTSVDGGIHTRHLHATCGEDLQSICFSCRRCDDGDGYTEAHMREAMLNGEDCAPCTRLRTHEVE